ncbi:hypothetical protein MJK72_06815 [Klebsiella pneumoniae]|nr:hypothetical protein MJK72_06815 [Klebsiella pneumoniae]
MTPSDENECRQMLYTGYHRHSDGPCVVRYPRGSGTGATLGAAGIAAARIGVKGWRNVRARK